MRGGAARRRGSAQRHLSCSSRFDIEPRRGDRVSRACARNVPRKAVRAPRVEGVPKSLVLNGVITAAGGRVCDVTLHAIPYRAARVLARRVAWPRRRFPPSTSSHRMHTNAQRRAPRSPACGIFVSSRTPPHRRPWLASARTAPKLGARHCRAGRVLWDTWAVEYCANPSIRRCTRACAGMASKPPPALTGGRVFCPWETLCFTWLPSTDVSALRESTLRWTLLRALEISGGNLSCGGRAGTRSAWRWELRGREEKPSNTE